MKATSRSDLAKSETNQLKRTQSKADLTKSSVRPSPIPKHAQSKMDTIETTGSRIPPTPLKRTQSKIDLTGSSLPRSQSSVRSVPGTRKELSVSQEDDNNPGAKRIKRSETDDAASTRPKSSEGRSCTISVTAPTPARKITSQTALPRLAASAARLMTPTKSSIARAQSAKANKSSSMIPSFLKSPSTSSLPQSPSVTGPARTASHNNLFTPSNRLQAMRDGARESMRKASENLQRVRSILRTPSRKFSDDPAKVAAGTHMSPPQVLDVDKNLPVVPATAPVKKQVNFTSSTLERANFDDMGKSPSPMKFRAGSEVPSGAVIYPSLGSGVQYPELSQDEDSSLGSPSRRLTFGEEGTAQSHDFSFSSTTPVKFGPASTGTIRMVRKSEASSILECNKRKLDSLEDKENDSPIEDMRSTKKMKPTPAVPPKTPVSTSKLPKRTPGRSSVISKSRLAFLAAPKRGKA